MKDVCNKINLPFRHTTVQDNVLFKDDNLMLKTEKWLSLSLCMHYSIWLCRGYRVGTHQVEIVNESTVKPREMITKIQLIKVIGISHHGNFRPILHHFYHILFFYHILIFHVFQSLSSSIYCNCFP